MARFKEYATQAIADDVARAVDITLGIPRKGTIVGKGPHRHVPSTYSAGANGWTKSACEVVRDPGTGNAIVVMIDSAAAISTRVVDVGGRNATIDFSSGVVATRPAKYAPKRQVP